MLKVTGTGIAVALAALIVQGGRTPAVGTEASGQLPQAVAKAVAELVYACRAAGQAIVAPASYISAADIDGDRVMDYVVDASKGCEANKAARCNADGCNIAVYLSSKQAGGAIALRGSQSSIEVASGQTSVKLVRNAPECQGAAAPAHCRETLRYSNGAFAKVQQ
ncbi:MAG TPA: hypothetical protein PK970_07350 [Hyphomicrobiaceae bacterium]|nr:hypothetical protein [Hyphomicrobiaceae bacterium]